MIDRFGEGYLVRTMSSRKIRQPWWGMVTRPGLRRAYFLIQASCNATSINETNNHASQASNRAILADIPNNAPTIAAVRSSSVPRNHAAPVSSSHNTQNKNQHKEASATNEAPRNRGLVSISSDYVKQPGHRN